MGDHSSVGVNCWVGTSLFRCFALRFFAQNRSYLRPTVSNLLSLKRATVIESFLSLCKKSNMSDSLVTFSNESLVFESGLLKKYYFLQFFTAFPFYSQEWIAPVAHGKRATGAIRSFPRGSRSFAHKKTSNPLKKLISKFPTLVNCDIRKYSKIPGTKIPNAFRLSLQTPNTVDLLYKCNLFSELTLNTHSRILL